MYYLQIQEQNLHKYTQDSNIEGGGGGLKQNCHIFLLQITFKTRRFLYCLLKTFNSLFLLDGYAMHAMHMSLHNTYKVHTYCENSNLNFSHGMIQNSNKSCNIRVIWWLFLKLPPPRNGARCAHPSSQEESRG
jgi:hypothetical protein